MAQENSALIRRWFEEVWNNGRMETIDEMASPDVVGHGQAQHDTVIGREQFKTFATEFRRAFPDLKVKIDHVLEQGDKVAARWTATMTHNGEFLGSHARGKKLPSPVLQPREFLTARLSKAGTTGTSWACWCRLARFRPRISCRPRNGARPESCSPAEAQFHKGRSIHARSDTAS